MRLQRQGLNLADHLLAVLPLRAPGLLQISHADFIGLKKRDAAGDQRVTDYRPHERESRLGISPEADNLLHHPVDACVTRSTKAPTASLVFCFCSEIARSRISRFSGGSIVPAGKSHAPNKRSCSECTF